MICNRFCIFTIGVICGALFFQSCAGSVSRQETVSTGVYEGSAQGRQGPVKVRIHMENGHIEDIEIIESGEDPFVGGAAIEELLELVLLYNSIDLDVISGATESSRGFLLAVENAILNHE